MSLYLMFIFLTSTHSKASILWDQWFAIHQNQKMIGYYQEAVELKNDEYHLRLNQSLKTNGKVNQENLAARAKNDKLLTPVFYNLRKTRDQEETSIDGSLDGKKNILTLRIRKSGKDLKPIRAQMAPGLIWVSMFSAWLHQNQKKVTSVQPKSFQAIIEDKILEPGVLDSGFLPVAKGHAFEMVPDAYAKKTKTRRIRVLFDQLVNYWWITAEGFPVRIEIPSDGIVVSLSDRKTVEKEFKE